MRWFHSANRFPIGIPAGLLLLAASLLIIGVPSGQSQTNDVLPRFFSYFGADLSKMDEMAQRYRVVIWHNHPNLRAALNPMRNRRPDLTAFMYRELFCVLQQETPLEESVGSYEWITLYHPDWFQLDTSGRRVEIPDYPGRWMMNFSNAGWREFWIRETLQDVIDGGWDGVFADDALTALSAHNLPPLAGYTNDSELQQAVYEFLSQATQAFHSAGKLLVANASNTYDYPGLWERWIDVTDGLMEEHFDGESWTWGKHVAPGQLQAMWSAAAKGKWVFCMTYGPWGDLGRMRTSLLAYLVAGGPRAYWAYRPYENSDKPAWHPSWLLPVGRPLENPQQQTGLWSRRFEQGTVVVNILDVPQLITIGRVQVQLAPQQSLLIEP